MRRDDVIARLKDTEPELRALGAAALYLFGSHARDEARADSDVDVFIDKDPRRRFGLEEYIGIYDLLQSRLGTRIGYTTREGLHELLRAEIEQSAIRIF